jgi:hypothetical protein
VAQAFISVIVTGANLVLWPSYYRSLSRLSDYFVLMFAAAILSLLLDIALWVYFGWHSADPPHLSPAAQGGS